MTLRKILMSPLVHFLALGALIFAVYAAFDDESAGPTPDAITLTLPDADRLAQQFTATWNRPPTVQELDGLMRSWALEEANVREALALGLDRGDSVIRQRLNLKMQFLAESGAAALIPEDPVLQAYLDANPERFRRPARVAFEQVIVPPGADATEILATLESGADPTTLGAASLLPPDFSMTPAPVIDRTFGAGFHTALSRLSLQSWQGPVESGYGQHLVRVTDRSDAALPPLSTIRDAVQIEWRAARAQEMRESFNRTLMERYSVTLPDAEAVLAR